MRRWMLVTSTAALIGGTTTAAAQSAAAVSAYDRYVALTDKRVAAELADPRTYLWIDGLAPDRRQTALATLGRGEVAISQMETRDERGARIDAPGAIVHHWIGTVFVPGATTRAALAVVQDYDRYGEIYAPLVPKGELVAHRDGDFTFRMRFAITGIISAVLDTDQQAHFELSDSSRAHSRVVSTRVAEVDRAGQPDERAKPPGSDRGYLWRLVSYWRFAERDGGTYIQCESISMSRSIPTGLGWIFGGKARAVPRDITEANLAATRKYLLRR